MTREQIDQFMSVNGEKFSVEDQAAVLELLRNANADQASAIESASFKSPMAALMLAIFLGCYGVDRFYLGSVGSGIAKLLLCGGCLIWWIMDIISAKKRCYAKNMEILAGLV